MSFAVIAISAAVGTVVVGAVGAADAEDDARGARNEQTRQQRKIDQLIEDRKEIQNPFSGVTSLSYLATDTTKNMGNVYASLGVATGAAEIQMEQSDMALANTLDTLRQTGASAGGATALAQAALQSKKGVAANIEQQELTNDKLRAQGEEKLQMTKMAEQQRLQSIAISEGQRTQTAEAQGIMYEFEKEEARTNMDLNRAAGLQDRAMQMEADSNANKSAAYGGMMNAFGQIGGAAMGMMGGAGGGMPGVESVGEVPTMGAAPTYTPGAGLQGTGVGMPGSDRRLKKNIKKIRKSASGLNIYSFEYIDESYGKGTYQGVMSDEIPAEAVINVNGYDRVDYSKIDVEFKQI
jgi:hypothetical protein